MSKLDKLRDPRLWMAVAEVLIFVSDSIERLITKLFEKKDGPTPK